MGVPRDGTHPATHRRVSAAGQEAGTETLEDHHLFAGTSHVPHSPVREPQGLPGTPATRSSAGGVFGGGGVPAWWRAPAG